MNVKQVSLVLLILAFAISLHQYMNWGVWFDLGDIHHELFISTFGFAGIILFYITRKEQT